MSGSSTSVSATVPHSAHTKHEQTVLPAYARIMLNSGMLTSYVMRSEADFREIFPVFADPRSQNPFKYTSRSKVNGQTMHSAPGGHLRHAQLSQYQAHRSPAS
jgi:hypothetical protein